MEQKIKEAWKLEKLSFQELATVLDLIEESFSLKADAAFFWNSLHDRKRSFVVTQQGQVLGHVLVTTLEDVVRGVSFYRLDYVCVKPENRCQGIGSFLLEQVEQLAKKEGIQWIEFTSGKKRTEAHRFYHQNQYQVRDTTVFQKQIKMES